MTLVELIYLFCNMATVEEIVKKMENMFYSSYDQLNAPLEMRLIHYEEQKLISKYLSEYHNHPDSRFSDNMLVACSVFMANWAARDAAFEKAEEAYEEMQMDLAAQDY